MLLFWSYEKPGWKNVVIMSILFSDFIKIFLGTYHSYLKVPSCKWYDNKYMLVSTQITNTEILTFVVVLVFKLLSCKVLFLDRKDNRNC